MNVVSVVAWRRVPVRHVFFSPAWSWIKAALQFNERMALVGNPYAVFVGPRAAGGWWAAVDALTVSPNGLGWTTLAPPTANPRAALSAGHAPRAVTEWERRLGPCGLPGPQLRLASIRPDGENTSQLEEQKQQRMDRRGRSNGDSDSHQNLADWRYFRLPTRGNDPTDDRTPPKRRQTWSPPHLCVPNRNPSRRLINKTRVKPTDGRYCFRGLPLNFGHKTAER